MLTNKYMIMENSLPVLHPFMRALEVAVLGHDLREHVEADATVPVEKAAVYEKVRALPALQP